MHGVGAPINDTPRVCTGRRPFLSGGPYLAPSGGWGGRRRPSCSAKGQQGMLCVLGDKVSLCRALWWGRGPGDSTGTAGLRARKLEFGDTEI